MSLTRRRFCRSLGASGLLSSAPFALTDVAALMQPSARAGTSAVPAVRDAARVNREMQAEAWEWLGARV